jgi:hypothetical protein
MTKELEEAKARLSAVLRDHERNPQAGTLYLIAADLRTLLSALSRGEGWSDDLVAEIALDLELWDRRFRSPNLQAELLLRKILAAAPPVPEGEE